MKQSCLLQRFLRNIFPEKCIVRTGSMQENTIRSQNFQRQTCIGCATARLDVHRPYID